VGRLGGLGAQGVALFDAEAVLLVDDDQAEVGEVDTLVEQGVGTDDNARPARGDLGQRPAARRRAQRTGQQGVPGGVGGGVQLAGPAARAEQVGDAPVVLL
jgi:hypothetical protein